MSYVKDYQLLVYIFSALLVFLVPIAFLSPALLASVPFQALPTYARYTVFGSIITGLWFYFSAKQLTHQQKMKVGTLNFTSGLDLVALCIPITIYMGTKQALKKWFG